MVIKIISASATDLQPYKLILEAIQNAFLSTAIEQKQIAWRVFENSDRQDHKPFIDAALRDNDALLGNLLHPIHHKAAFLERMVYEGKPLLKWVKHSNSKVAALLKRLNISIETIGDEKSTKAATPAVAVPHNTAALAAAALPAHVFGDDIFNEELPDAGNMLANEATQALAAVVDNQNVNAEETNVIADALFSFILNEAIKIAYVFFNHNEKNTAIEFRIAISISQALVIIKNLNDWISQQNKGEEFLATLHHTQVRAFPQDLRLQIRYPLSKEEFNHQLQLWKKTERLEAVLLIYRLQEGRWKAYKRTNTTEVLDTDIDPNSDLARALRSLKQSDTSSLTAEVLLKFKILIDAKPLFVNHAPIFFQHILIPPQTIMLLIEHVQIKVAEWEKSGWLHYYRVQEYNAMIAPLITDLNATAQHTWKEAELLRKMVIFNQGNNVFLSLPQIVRLILQYAEDNDLIEVSPTDLKTVAQPPCPNLNLLAKRGIFAQIHIALPLPPGVVDEIWAYAEEDQEVSVTQPASLEGP